MKGLAASDKGLTVLASLDNCHCVLKHFDLPLYTQCTLFSDGYVIRTESRIIHLVAVNQI